jgi:hypothetical protein
MFAFADMVHFFAHKFSRLSAWGFPFAGIFLGAFDGFSCRHTNLQP